MNNSITSLESNILRASVLGTESAGHEWKKAPCQYHEIMDMIKGNEVGDKRTSKIFKAFNENRAMQLAKLRKAELTRLGFYD